MILSYTLTITDIYSSSPPSRSLARPSPLRNNHLLSDLSTSPAHTQQRHALASRITSLPTSLPTYILYSTSRKSDSSLVLWSPAGVARARSIILPSCLLPASFLPASLCKGSPCRRFHFLPCVSTYPRSPPSPPRRRRRRK